MVRSDDPGRWDDGEAGPEADTGDPAEAFDALRRRIEEQGAQLGAEMAVIRQGVERAFEEFDRITVPEDYKPQLAQIVKQLGVVAHRMDSLEQTPVLRHGPDHYARQMAQAGSSLVREAAGKLDGCASDFHRATTTLSGYMDSARDHDRQNLWLAGAAGVGLILGVLLIVALPSILPGRVAPWVASLVMGQSQADAGRAMIQSGDQARYQRMVWAEWVFANNVEALERCVAEMQQSGQDRSCTITVPAPKE